MALAEDNQEVGDAGPPAKGKKPMVSSPDKKGPAIDLISSPLDESQAVNYKQILGRMNRLCVAQSTAGQQTCPSKKEQRLRRDMDVNTLVLDLLQVLVFYNDTASFNSIVDMSWTTFIATETEADYHIELVRLLAMCTVGKKLVPVVRHMSYVRWPSLFPFLSTGPCRLITSPLF